MDIATALKTSGIEPIDAEAMLAFLLQKDRAYVLAHPEGTLDASIEKRWKEYLERRKTGEPIAYIIGQREFYGRIFHVDRRVHIPRPSTEDLVSMALDFLKEPKDEVRELETGIIGTAKVLRDCSAVKTVVDVGTGSGCIAITVKLERPDLRVIAIDISAEALEVAKANADRLGANVEFLEGDLLSPVGHLTDSFIVVSNPPYLSEEDIDANADLDHEPRMALYGGEDRDALVNVMQCQAHAIPLCAGIVIEHMG